MVRHTDMEIIVMKENVYMHRSLETGMLHYAGPCKEGPGLGGRRKMGERGPESLLGFAGEGMGEVT